MELITSELTALEPIKFNYDELKQFVTEKATVYKNRVYSTENIKEAKNDRAALNKIIKAMTDERKRIKNHLLLPFVDFEAKCKEIENIIEEASKSIDTQVKAFEEQEENAKLQEIVGYFVTVVGEYSEVLDFDSIFNDRWLNKTYGMEKVKQDIDHILAKTKQDIECIDGQVADAELRKQVKMFYFKNINNPSVLSLALQEAKRIVEANTKISNLENKASEVNGGFVTTNEQTSEPVAELKFRAFVTAKQADLLKKFLIENHIRVERI